MENIFWGVLAVWGKKEINLRIIRGGDSLGVNRVQKTIYLCVVQEVDCRVWSFVEENL